ncbi:hypothetical protein [Cryptosporangium phraense]|uniref:Uncharacterized protein n=1 Tax=Cryptosporangium phraense TaxID=2593070 RepID=A0A545B0G6_9ACTN|nr:hypothetical protein [Cryptosporangium phraense]TQS47076.1 hypothetical protein FL583_02105 [Cryptosporangium phraense]
MTERRDFADGAGFRDLEGIGAASEVRLHRAGVLTWGALAEIVDALRGERRGSGVRSEPGDRLGELAEQLTAHPGAQCSGAQHPVAGPGGQRQEAFVLRLTLTDTGRPTRGTLTHVRTGQELALVGWSGEAVSRFVEERAGVEPGRVPAAPSPAALPAASPVASPVALPVALPVASPPEAGGDFPPAGAWPAVPWEAPCRGELRQAVYDVGRVVGGAPQSIEVTLLAAGPGPDLGYCAELLGRRFGEPDTSWAPLAVVTGHGPAPAALRLRFPDVVVPSGLCAVRLRLTALDGPLPAYRAQDQRGPERIES